MSSKLAGSNGVHINTIPIIYRKSIPGLRSGMGVLLSLGEVPSQTVTIYRACFSNVESK